MPAGTALEFIGMNGQAVRREAQVTVFVKRPPREALVCGGIGTWQTACGATGRLVLRQRHADRRSILGAGVVPTLGLVEPRRLDAGRPGGAIFGTAAGPWSSPKRAGRHSFGARQVS